MNTILLFAALKVLAIGNSFSVCTQRELPQVAKSLGCELDLVTMTIGGCSLERHWNCLTNATDLTYGLDWNRCGVKQGDWPELKALQKPVERTHWKTHKKQMGTGANLEAVLKAVKFDVVTVQQASHFSWQPETYAPWGDLLVAKVRELQPQAEIVVQETWSYTPWDKRLAKWGIDQDEMYAKLHDAYGRFAKKYGFRVIPTGTAVQLWRKELPVKYAENSFGGDVCGSAKFERGADGKWTPKGDVFHFNSDGCYLQALVWCAKLCGADVTKCPYAPKGLDPVKAELMKKVAMEAVFKPVDVSFARGKWNPDDFMLVKCARHDFIGSFDQLDDCVANHCPPGATPEEVYKKHNNAVYAAMVHKRKFDLGTTVSSRMGYDWLMAPLIVIARDLGQDAQGRPELREHWEVVLYNQGLNVWHHFYENGKQRWFKAASLQLPKDAYYKANEAYDLVVKVSRDSRKNKMMTVSCNGYTLQYVDESLPEEFYAGVIGCEGRNFFYDFKADKRK